jgi:hypothetical protein
MDRQELDKKTKPELLALAQAAGLATTPALTKSDLVELLLAAGTLGASSSPADTDKPAESVDLYAAANARVAELEAQLAAAQAAQAGAPADMDARIAAAVAAALAQAAPAAAATAAKRDPLAVNDPEEDRRNPMPREGQLRTLDGALVDYKRVRVTIMATEHEKDDVKLGLNGHMLQIKRGVPVDIPHHYLEVLRNSTVDTFTKDPETGVVSRVQIQRYPYTVDMV